MGQPVKPSSSNWFIEQQTPNSAHMYCISSVYYLGKTKFQDVAILELPDLGKTLVLDGKVQSSIRDEYIYHETLVHPVMLTHPNPRSVLVIGGGEGATLREVLKHDTVEEAVMVDLDEELIEITKKYLPEFHQGSFDDKRVRLVFGDGRKFVEECTPGRFDVVICDLTDPAAGSPAIMLYTLEFYRMVYDVLKEDGIMVTQAESPSHTGRSFGSIYKTIGEVFPITRAYTLYIQSFDAEWGFVLGSKRFDPLDLTEDEEARRIEARRVNLRFYEPRIKRRLFTLPRNILELMDRGVVSTDSNPVYEPV